MKNFIMYLSLFILIVFIIPVILTNRKTKEVTSNEVIDEKELNEEALRQFFKNQIIT